MPDVSSDQTDSPGGAADRGQRRLKAAVKESMRELSVQLSLLNAQVSAHLKLKEADIDCLDVITRYGPVSPSATGCGSDEVATLTERAAMVDRQLPMPTMTWRRLPRILRLP